MTPDERLDLIEARADAAMPGPWAATRTLLRSGCVGIAVHQRAGGKFVMVDRDREVRVEDAEFMAAAREDVPWLIGQLRDAQAEIERLNLVVAAMDSQADENITEVLALTADRDHWRTEWEDADAKRITAEAELAAERAKVQAGLAWLTKAEPFPEINGDMFRGLRAALTGGEQ